MEIIAGFRFACAATLAASRRQRHGYSHARTLLRPVTPPAPGRHEIEQARAEAVPRRPRHRRAAAFPPIRWFSVAAGGPSITTLQVTCDTARHRRTVAPLFGPRWVVNSCIPPYRAREGEPLAGSLTRGPLSRMRLPLPSSKASISPCKKYYRSIRRDWRASLIAADGSWPARRCGRSARVLNSFDRSRSSGAVEPMIACTVASVFLTR